MIDAIITGGNGFLGRLLKERLNRDGFHFLSIDSSSTDITCSDVWNSLPESRVVYHLAGKSFIPQSWDYENEFFRVNVQGTTEALSYCRKNNSQIVFEQNIQVRLKELSTSIQKLEIDLTKASKKTENFISERELVASLAKLESQIISNKEEFDLKFLELGSIKKQSETNSVNIDSLETEIRSMILMPLEKKQKKDVPKEEILDKATDNTEKSIPINQSIQENFREIQKSTIYGTPYKTSLDNIERMLGLNAPDILRNLAETGIPTMQNLTETFPEFSRLALSADRNEKETDDFKLLTFLKSQFQARSTIPRQGSDPDAVLSRSEAFLKSNDLEKSLFELTQLDGIASKVMEPWRISAESRIESLLAVEQLLKSTEK